MHFIASDYSATGEGRTISILITYLHPKPEDYEIKPHIEEQRDENGRLVFNPGVLKTKPEDILFRDFAETFDGWMAMGAEILEKEEFIRRFGRMVPDMVIKFINEPMGNFRYFTQIHYNLS
jgi:hypothetical protein